MLHFYKAKVTSITDADTFKCLVDVGFDTHHSIIVRLLGVDAPETRTKDLKEKELGNKASDMVKLIVADHQMKLYLKTKKKDSFGRWLAEVYLDEDMSQHLNTYVHDITVKLRGEDGKNNKLQDD